MRLPCCTTDLSLLNNFQEKERFIFYCKIMKLALFVLLVAVATTIEIVSADSADPSYYEAMKADVESAMNSLRTSMNERLNALQAAGDSVRASALKTMTDGLTNLQTRLGQFQPTSKTGQMLLDGIKSALKSLESTFNRDFKN